MKVFLLPPWPEIYVADAERRHNFDAAAAEYLHLVEAYALLGYQSVILPKIGVKERPDYILRVLGP